MTTTGPARSIKLLFPLLLACWAATSTADVIKVIPCPPLEGTLCKNGQCSNATKACTKESDCATEDINGDGTNDWVVSDQKDSANNRIVYACINKGEQGAFHSLTYTPAGGKARLIGKCAFMFGQNGVEVIKDEATQKFTSTKWITLDAPLYENGKIVKAADQDGDGKEDKFAYGYSVATNKLTIVNLEDNKLASTNTITPKESPFDDKDLPPPPPDRTRRDLEACSCEGCRDEDLTSPLCFMSDLNPGPPTTLEVTAQDDESGILSVKIVTLVNSRIEVPKGSGDFYEQGDVVIIPLDERDGTKLIEAEKIDESLRAQVLLEVTNGNGLSRRCDPVITMVIRQAGRPEQLSYTDIPQAEGQITIYNGSPGLKQLDVQVNGRNFDLALKDGRQVRVNVSSAMRPGSSNVVTLTAHGKPGGSATVVVHE